MTLASRSMEERARRRRIRQELFNDFKETAQGMMDNIQEAERSAEQHWNRVSETLQRDMEALRSTEDPKAKIWEEMERGLEALKKR